MRVLQVCISDDLSVKIVTEDEQGRSKYTTQSEDRAAPEFYAAAEALVLPALRAAEIPQAEGYSEGARACKVCQTFPDNGRSRAYVVVEKLLDDSDAKAPATIDCPNKPIEGKGCHSVEFIRALDKLMGEALEYAEDGKRAQMEIPA